MAQDKKTRKLARQIQTRMEFLKQTTGAVINLVIQKGTWKEEVKRFHTYVSAELRDFGGFSFEVELGKTEEGGNTVKMYCHPGRKFREGGLDSAWDKEFMPVLSVDFWSGDSYEVRTFSDEFKWQKALSRVLKNKDKISTRIAATAEKEKQKTKKLAANPKTEVTKDQLIVQAERLSITVQ